MKNGTVVWDLESAPDNLSDWASNKFADWGTVAVPNTWEPTVVKGKGVNGSAALCWTQKVDAWGATDFLKISNDSSAVTDWTGATELMFYIDATEIKTGYDNSGSFALNVGLNSVDLGKAVHKAGSAWYLWDNGAWEEQAVNPHGHMMVPNGYKGYIRLPLANLEEQPESMANVSRILFYATLGADLNAPLYFDNFTINVAGEQEEEPAVKTVPDEVKAGTIVWDMENTGSLEGKLTNLFLELWPDNTDAVKGDITTGKMAIEIKDGKGFEGSKALMFKINEYVWGQTYYVDFTGDKNAVTDWTGAENMFFWIDNSGTDGDNPIDVILNSDGNNHLKKDAPWATFENGKWVERKVNEWNHLIIPAGYVGWVKLPLSTLGHTTDMSNVTRIAFYSEKVGPLYFDNFAIDVKGPASTGDTFPAMVFALLGTSAAALAVLVIGKKKYSI